MEQSVRGVRGGVGTLCLSSCVLPSLSPYNTMTTAVQSSELVFEFASNGMDEINQVHHNHICCFLCENILIGPSSMT